MVIHVVRRGDTIYFIARNYGVNEDDIINANKLQSPNQLVIGQSLIIPAKERTYRVNPGDSIWSISRRFSVPPERILELNNISSSDFIYPGQILRIPEKERAYGDIEVNAFIQPSTDEREKNVLSESIQYLTYLSPFSYHVNKDGSLTSIKDENILAMARENKVAPMLSVSNISGANFDTQLISDILKSNELQQTLINNILQVLKAKNYYGVIIDFERIPPNQREDYNNFLRKLKVAISPSYKLSVALAPKTYDITEGSWHGAHDYKTIGDIADFVIIMTYEWGWSGGPPMAVAPINEVEKVIGYAVSVIDPKKIMMGVPYYGYDWTLPYIPGGEFAESIGNVEAVDRARRYGAEIKYDIKSKSPYYTYLDQNGREHVVWFEDVRSIERKANLVRRYGLKGVSYWALGRPFPQNWETLDRLFKIKKLY